MIYNLVLIHARICLLSSSDHSSVKLKLRTDLADDRGRGYWKFSSSLLENNQFVFDMKNKINEISSAFKDFDDPRVNWEYLKFKMRQFSRFTAKQFSKSRKEAREKLELKIENFEKNENPSQDEFADYEKAKAELEKYMLILRMTLFYGLKHNGMKREKMHLSIF